MEYNPLDTLKQIWPEWQIEEPPIGRGTYGKVYRAVRKDYQFESYSAIKVISVPQNPSELDSLYSEGLDIDASRTYLRGIVNDFIGEIQMMESLKGARNIVNIEDYKVVERKDSIGWDIFIRMEMLTPLNKYVSNKKLTEDDVIKIGCDICTALEICSMHNIIHRDIKPENILVNDYGDFKLGDFGVARSLENVTGSLSLKGTFSYMAPEVANHGKYDARADIYSLGLVLYSLLNHNRLPFLDINKQFLTYEEKKEAVSRRLHGEDPGFPCDAFWPMAIAIESAIAYLPDDRHASAAEMKRKLMNAREMRELLDLNEVESTGQLEPDIPASEVPDVKAPDVPVGDAPTPSASDTPERREARPAVGTFGNKQKDRMPLIISVALLVLIFIGTEIFIVPNTSAILSRFSGIESNDAFNNALSENQASFPDPSEAPSESQDVSAELSNAGEAAESACKYLGKDILAYNNGLYYAEYDGKSSFNLAGATYKYGFTIGTYEYGGTANFNLGGKYHYFAGVAGDVDGVNCSVTYNVLGDDELLGTIDVKGMLLPTPFEFDVSGVRQLTIVATGEDNYEDGVGFGNAVLYNEASDKPVLYESTKLPDTAYLGADIKSYVSGLYYEEYDGMSAFRLAGEPYTKGFTIGTYPYVGYTSFNIGGNYTALTGVAGNVDGVNFSVSYIVFGDGDAIGTIDIKGGGLPTEFSFDVTGITQLGFIVTDSDSNYGSGVGFGNVVLQ